VVGRHQSPKIPSARALYVADLAGRHLESVEERRFRDVVERQS
jgi:hypothetical protein